jgi:hypothetical protein
MTPPLAINGLLMPPDFPFATYERAYERVTLRVQAHASYIHFVGAWNALSFRYLTMIDEGAAFTASITAPNAQGDIALRYPQERHLFGFFGSGFSIFEAFYYGMYAVGGALMPTVFPLATAKDQQNVSPTSTSRAFQSAFSGDPLLTAFQLVFDDSAYKELKEVRNILTHRTAPGRTIYVGIGSDEDLPAVWKLNNIPLDAQLTSTRRTHIARLIGVLVDAAATFVESKWP